MAERRMFAKTIIRSDAFLDMPSSSQNLYFQLNAEADDEGFVNNPKSVMRVVGSSDDDLRLLIMKKFIIPFESGVIVIKHWKIHNYIRGDRIHETKYQKEKALLELDENSSYRLTDNCQADVGHLVDSCHTEVRLGKDRIDKDRIDTGGAGGDKPARHKYGEYKNVLLTDDQLEKLKAEYPDWQQRIERLSSYIASTGKSYKNHLATIRNWSRMDKDKQKISGKSFSERPASPDDGLLDDVF